METRLKVFEKTIAGFPDVVSKCDKLVSSVAELRRSVESFNADMENFRKIFKETVEDVRQLKVKVGALEAENLSLKRQVGDLGGVVEDIAYKEISLDLEVDGIPKAVVDDAKGHVQNIADFCKVKPEERDIVSVERMVRRDGKDGVIKIRFRSKVKRDDFIRMLRPRG